MANAPTTLKDITAAVDKTAPFSLAADWDNVGLMIGDPQQTITGVLVGLDPTSDLLDQAIKANANLIITHHPPIFTPLKQIHTQHPTGAFIAKAISNQLAVISCHTNLDVIPEGVSTVLATKLGLTDLCPLVVTEKDNPTIGFGQIGKLKTPQNGQDFLNSLCCALDLPTVSYAGPLPEQISIAAVCGGSGSDLSEEALASGAQVYITGEVKHNIAIWAAECGFCVIDASHFATENPISKIFADLLKQQFIACGIETPVQAANQNNPFSYFMMNK